jgi:hypothetical protein
MLATMLILALSTAQHNSPLQPFLKANCIDCHGAETTKGDLNLETLHIDAIDLPTLLQWDRVRARLQARDMPPKETLRPDPQTYRDALIHVEAIIDQRRTAQPSRGTSVAQAQPSAVAPCCPGPVGRQRRCAHAASG